MDSSQKSARGRGKSAQSIHSLENLRDFGTFDFVNGDKYEGQFLAVKHNLSIVRDGEGSYFSNQSVYSGKWNKDLLEKADAIIFRDGSTYSGTLENMTLEGPGMYKFKEGTEIRGTLKDNQFVGDIELKDLNGNYWKALNPMNEEEVIFSPVHPFYQSVLNISSSVLPYRAAEGDA